MNTERPKVLLDASILSCAELAEPAEIERTLLWGGNHHSVKMAGYRKRVFDDPSLQAEVDAIVTIGRLIREGRITAFSYIELELESFRRSIPLEEFYALNDCKITSCPAPIERSKFRQTSDFYKYVAKGGKKDRKSGLESNDFSQISFLTWLLQLTDSQIEHFLAYANHIELTEFEIESFRRIEWFRFVCSRVGSPENYPDVFHLWAAERNEIDVFLTLEKRLPNIMNQIMSGRQRKQEIKVSVLRPIELLEKIGVSVPDQPPIEAGRLYTFMDAHK